REGCLFVLGLFLSKTENWTILKTREPEKKKDESTIAHIKDIGDRKIEGQVHNGAFRRHEQ
ncbi:hypothetical protein ACIFOT_30980, partial [Neobacillus sp. NRS-1170]|uniref:hypothetical protein n=1 Tax=Neobacillus sp. NRS-1170 TaxID=3233898 RepID=UPI003D26FCEA